MRWAHGQWLAIAAAQFMTWRIQSSSASGLSKERMPSFFKKHGITIHTFSNLLFTEAGNEFGLHKLTEEDTNDLWNAASSSEWNRAKQMERNSKARRMRINSTAESRAVSDSASAISPFVVCDPEEGKSGYICRRDIEAYFGEAVMGIFNDENMTCYFVSTMASIAETPPPPLIVHPLVPEMKLQEGIVAAISQSDALPSRLYSMFCPGHSKSQEDAERIAFGIISSMQEKNGRSLAANIFLRNEDSTADDLQHNQTVSREYDMHLLWTKALEQAISSQNDFDYTCDDMFSQINLAASEDGDSFTIDLPEGYELFSPCIHSLLAGLSIRPEICSIGIVPNMKTMNKEAQWIVQSNVKDRLPFFDSGLTGMGEVVAVSDSGLDTDNCYFWDSTGDVERDGSVDISRRKVIQYVAYADDSDVAYGHGTHVTGTGLGRQASNGRDETTGAGDGIARDAKVAFFDIGNGRSPYLMIPRTASQLFNPGKQAGARIHSASWGSNYNGYSYDERDFDNYLYQNDDFIVVVAAGNAGNAGRNTVGSPATSKNVISVGASQNSEPHIEPGMLGKDYLAGFSGRGPTQDGRTKPDVVAPGMYIRSAASRPSTGECGPAALQFLAGTSMAAPVVSGAAAIVRQYFRDGYYPSGKKNEADEMEPSGSLVKAVLLNGGQNLFGRNIEPYDVNQNFGRVSLIDSLPLEGENTIRAKIVDRKSLTFDESDEIVVVIDKSGGCQASDLSVTLVWTDPPAAPNCARCLRNDLDLFLTKDGNSRIFFANGRNSRDTINNAERVRVRAQDKDRFVINVEAKNLDTRSQSYSLVITGCLADGDSDFPTEDVIANEPSPSPSNPPFVATQTPVQTMTPAPTPKPVSNNTAPVSSDSISTEFSGRTYWYGNMFDIQAKQDIVISSVDIHTLSEGVVNVEVWTKSGSLVRSQQSSNEWERVAVASVQGRGVNQPTPIPVTNFSQVRVGASSIQAFYVTLDSRDMLLSKGGRFGRISVENEDLVIKEGLASTYAFGDYYFPYTWNGAIKYARDGGSKLYQTVSTIFDANTEYRYYGNMFDADAGDEDVTVIGMDIHTLATSDVYVEVWSRAGSYEGHELDASGWTRITSTYVSGMGAGSQTAISPDLFDEAIIPSRGTRAFYVTLITEELLYSPGDTSYSNQDVTIRSGIAIGLYGDTYAPRIWNGALLYRK